MAWSGSWSSSTTSPVVLPPQSVTNPPGTCEPTLRLIPLPYPLPGGRGDIPKTLSSWLDLPAPPSADPDRTACLMQMLSHLGRLLRYCLLFPPSNPSLPPALPVERILAAISCGLKPAPAGHVTEALVLQAAIPVVHATMWNVLSVLIRTCHAHLLPYADHMTSLLTSALCSRDPDQ